MDGADLAVRVTAPPRGHEEARGALDAGIASGAMHHAWLLIGPQGVGKARIAREAAVALLSRSAFAADEAATRALVDAGSHPDFRRLARLPRDIEAPQEELARSITIAQVRGLQPLFATTPSLGSRRVVLIDAVDDLERGGANALLKNLEEPPSGTVFFLVSHTPGRLLPTIRSRCRALRFGRLDDADVAAVVRDHLPDADPAEIATLVAAGEGSPGRALRFAGLKLAEIDAAVASIVMTGDPDNRTRLALARALSGKAAQPRYEAFLERMPVLLADEARRRGGAGLAPALDAYRAARDLAGAAVGLSLDAQATVVEMGGIAARLHQR